MRLRTTCTLLLAPILLAPATGARAQQSDAPVPRELALALLAGYGTGSVLMSEMVPRPAPLEIRVGRVPETLPDGVLPRDAEVLGSLVGPEQSTTVAVLAEAPAAVREAFEARLTRAGGWRLPAFTRREEQDAGFAVGVPTLNVIPFCRDGELLLVAAIPRGAGSLLRVHHSREEPLPMCGQVPPSDRLPSAEGVIPRLNTPEGVRVTRGGGGGSGDRWETHARLETDMQPGTLLAHYAAQLREAGWVADSPVSEGPVAVQALRFQDAEGRSWHGVLLASAPSGTTTREMLFRATLVSSSR